MFLGKSTGTCSWGSYKEHANDLFGGAWERFNSYLELKENRSWMKGNGVCISLPSLQWLRSCPLAKRQESCSFVKVNLKMQRQSFQTVLSLKFLMVFLWSGIVLGTDSGCVQQCCCWVRCLQNDQKRKGTWLLGLFPDGNGRSCWV